MRGALAHVILITQEGLNSYIYIYIYIYIILRIVYLSFSRM